MIYPLKTAITSPESKYARAILYPNSLIKIASEARSAIGDIIRKLSVTPMLSPALQNPIKSGMLEHEQKGVKIPSKAPKILPQKPFMEPKISLVLCGGK